MQNYDQNQSMFNRQKTYLDFVSTISIKMVTILLKKKDQDGQEKRFNKNGLRNFIID